MVFCSAPHCEMAAGKSVNQIHPSVRAFRLLRLRHVGFVDVLVLTFKRSLIRSSFLPMALCMIGVLFSALIYTGGMTGSVG
jgi:hypothetical protein